MSPEVFQLPAAHALERRRLAAFLVASLVLHALVIIGLPGFTRDVAVSPMAVLEVTLVSARPLPVASSEPPPMLQPPPRHQDLVPLREAVREGQNASVPAQPKTDPQERSFTVAPSRLAEAVPAAPEPKIQAANAVLTPPNFNAQYLNNPAPAYPPTSRRTGEQGTVMLRVLVKRDGLPLSVEIEKSSGSRQLDMAARDAVWGWRFVPAMLGTDPVESWVLVPVVFRLDGAS